MNPALTQAQFNLIADRFFYLLGKVFSLREMRFRFEQSVVRIQEFNDVNDFTSLWDLSGVDIGVNTNADGRLFVRITDASPNTVNVYKATGGGAGDLVATGTAADGAVCTLTASNSSGITGTVLLATISSSLSDDKLQLRCYVDYPVRDAQVFDGAETLYDAAIRAKIQATNTEVVSSLKAAEGLLLDDVKTCLTDYIAAKINSGASSALSKESTNDDGAISLEVVGILEDLRDAMEDNTTVQYILRNVISVGSATFPATNVGKGSMVTPTAYEKMLPGTITFRCVDETIGSEEFEVSLRRSDTGDIVKAANNMRVKKEFKDAHIGISSATLQRTFSKTGDGTHLHLSDVTDGNWSTSGESSSNTSAGTLHWKIVANGGNWNVEFYKASTYQSGDLVAKATAIATATIFQATAQNSSGLTVNGKTGSAPVTATTGTFLLQPFKSGPPADAITCAITRTSYGEIQRYLAELVDEVLDWYLNSSAIGTVTLADSYLLRGCAAIHGLNS